MKPVGEGGRPQADQVGGSKTSSILIPSPRGADLTPGVSVFQAVLTGHVVRADLTPGGV